MIEACAALVDAVLTTTLVSLPSAPR